MKVVICWVRAGHHWAILIKERTDMYLPLMTIFSASCGSQKLQK